MHYTISYLLCLACTVMTLLLTDWDNAKWLLVSDINVAIWFAVAMVFERRGKQL